MMLAVLTLTCLVALSAQSRWGGWGRRDIPYDGEVTFVRLRWTRGTFGVPTFQRGINAFMHEFPRAEQNLSKILGELTHIDTFQGPTGGNILTLHGLWPQYNAHRTIGGQQRDWPQYCGADRRQVWAAPGLNRTVLNGMAISTVHPPSNRPVLTSHTPFQSRFMFPAVICPSNMPPNGLVWNMYPLRRS